MREIGLLHPCAVNRVNAAVQKSSSCSSAVVVSGCYDHPHESIKVLSNTVRSSGSSFTVRVSDTHQSLPAAALVPQSCAMQSCILQGLAERRRRRPRRRRRRGRGRCRHLRLPPGRRLHHRHRRLRPDPAQPEANHRQTNTRKHQATQPAPFATAATLLGITPRVCNHNQQPLSKNPPHRSSQATADCFCVAVAYRQPTSLRRSYRQYTPVQGLPLRSVSDPPLLQPQVQQAICQEEAASTRKDQVARVLRRVKLLRRDQLSL